MGIWISVCVLIGVAGLLAWMDWTTQAEVDRKNAERQRQRDECDREGKSWPSELYIVTRRY